MLRRTGPLDAWERVLVGRIVQTLPGGRALVDVGATSDALLGYVLRAETDDRGDLRLTLTASPELTDDLRTRLLGRQVVFRDLRRR